MQLISFRLYLVLYACVQRYSITVEGKNFWELNTTLREKKGQKSLVPAGSAG
jgi:hypothetical protein